VSFGVGQTSTSAGDVQAGQNLISRCSTWTSNADLEVCPTWMGLACVGMLLVFLSGCTRSAALPVYGTVPDFTLTDQSGAAFRAGEKLSGRVWIADFMFTNCMGPCPRMTSHMQRLASETAARQPNLRFVSFTVDPDRDTPAALADYARRFRADTSRWSFLTGPRAALHDLCRKAFLLGDVDGSLEHSTKFVLVDSRLRIRGYYDSGDAASLQQLVADSARVAD
jgi:protein SCO1